MPQNATVTPSNLYLTLNSRNEKSIAEHINEDIHLHSKVYLQKNAIHDLYRFDEKLFDLATAYKDFAQEASQKGTLDTPTAQHKIEKFQADMAQTLQEKIDYIDTALRIAGLFAGALHAHQIKFGPGTVEGEHELGLFFEAARHAFTQEKLATQQQQAGILAKGTIKTTHSPTSKAPNSPFKPK